MTTVTRTVPSGPTGLGTAAAHIRRQAPDRHRPGTAPLRPIPGLYWHPAIPPDPALVAEVERRTKAWAKSLELFPPEWEDQFDGFGVGRAICLCHPDYATIDHLVAAARLLMAENAVDDQYCEEHGGSPHGLGARLAIAHSALDLLHTTAEYTHPWREGMDADSSLRAYYSAMHLLNQVATPDQMDRERHDLARLHLGYLAEAAWAIDKQVPEVWQYLVMRQFNNFRPCLTLTDAVAGYELPRALYTLPQTQRVTALAGNITTIVNDLYSYTKEAAASRPHLNLPVVIAVRESLPPQEAYFKAIDMHNELMRTFETESVRLATDHPAPALARYLTGLAAWISGNHEWHATNTHRYTLPDYWRKDTDRP